MSSKSHVFCGECGTPHIFCFSCGQRLQDLGEIDDKKATHDEEVCAQKACTTSPPANTPDAMQDNVTKSVHSPETPEEAKEPVADLKIPAMKNIENEDRQRSQDDHDIKAVANQAAEEDEDTRSEPGLNSKRVNSRRPYYNYSYRGRIRGRGRGREAPYRFNYYGLTSEVIPPQIGQNVYNVQTRGPYYRYAEQQRQRPYAQKQQWQRNKKRYNYQRDYQQRGPSERTRSRKNNRSYENYGTWYNYPNNYVQ